MVRHLSLVLCRTSRIFISACWKGAAVYRPPKKAGVQTVNRLVCTLMIDEYFLYGSNTLYKPHENSDQPQVNGGESLIPE